MKCKYDKCRMEAERGNNYCKYHIRMVDMEKKRSPGLKEIIKIIERERYGEVSRV